MDLTPTLTRLLALGPAGRHPAGAVLGVWAEGRSQVAAEGWARLPDDTDVGGVPMQPTTRLDLASITKIASTTTLAMLLVSESRLGLDDPVAAHLPEFPHHDVTVEHLLTHTSGLRAWWPLYCTAHTREQAVDLAVRMPLTRTPGSAWEYSDLGLIVMGAVIERVTGRRLDAAFSDLVARPLGLTDLGYGPVPAEGTAVSADSDAYELTMLATGTPHRTPFTASDFGGWRSRPTPGVVNDGNAAHALEGVAGHAGLFGSVPALIGLGRALRSGFVPASVLARFALPTSVEPIQAVGFRRRQLSWGGRSVDLLWHGGFTGTFFALAPAHDLVIAAGVTRLHGVTGPLPDPHPAPGDPLIPTVGNDEIQRVIVEGISDAS